MTTLGLGIGHFLVLHDQGRGEEPEHDQDRDDGVGELEGEVVLGLAGNLVAPAPIAKDGPDDQERDQQADNDGADGESLPEVEDRARRRGDAGVCPEGRNAVLGGNVSVAASEDERGDRHDGETAHATPAAGATRVSLRGQGRWFHSGNLTHYLMCLDPAGPQFCRCAGVRTTQCWCGVDSRSAQPKTPRDMVEVARAASSRKTRWRTA